MDDETGLAPLLAVEGLTIGFPTETGWRRAVDDLSFALGRGERVALVGESGSGKSQTARALIGLSPPSARVTARRMRLEDTDLRALAPRGWNGLRGRRIGFIPQDPKFSLNPARRIGWQVEETLRLHTGLSRAERRERALAMLETVGLPDPARLYRSYPAELSGGMGQRAMIAAMLIEAPRLVIADEPTSALDARLRDQILKLLGRLTAERGMTLLLISHDLQQVTRFTERVLVLYRGRLVDAQPAAELARSPHPYTRMLWGARPSAATYGTRLPVQNRDAALERARMNPA